MSLDWIQFIRSAIDQVPDDPFVQLLRGRLSAGCQVVRVCFQRACFKYHVTLMCRQMISDVRIPHAAPFTHWSFEAGRRMHTMENEAERFEVLLGEKFRPVEDEVGRTYLQAIVVEIVRQLQPPATARDNRAAGRSLPVPRRGHLVSLSRHSCRRRSTGGAGCQPRARPRLHARAGRHDPRSGAGSLGSPVLPCQRARRPGCHVASVDQRGDRHSPAAGRAPMIHA